MLKIIDYKTEKKYLLDRLNSRLDEHLEEEKSVRKILLDIRSYGDEALFRYTKKYDGFLLNSDNIKVCEEEIEKSYSNFDKDLLDIMREAADNVRIFHNQQKEDNWFYETSYGSILGQFIRPIESVAIYAPGGSAFYPSSLIMGIIPAQIAGVKDIYVATPPGNDGQINMGLLALCKLLNINQIYRMGGAQAIGALSFGTESVKKVEKIVGPGNIYVALAKKMIFGRTDIDMIAGPSEICIIADNKTNPDYAVADLFSQAEHDPAASVYIISDSKDFLNRVIKIIPERIKQVRRSDIIRQVIDNNFFIIKSIDMENSFEISNLIAPEHLEVLLSCDYSEYIELIKHAGAVFSGEYSPESVGDYFAGSNHVLPTSGTARFSSPLGVYDFIKRSSFIKYSEKEFNKNKNKIRKFAEYEGLFAHADSIAIRK